MTNPAAAILGIGILAMVVFWLRKRNLKARNSKEASELIALVTSEAFYNRAARSKDTLFLYSSMVAEHENPGKSGQIAFSLLDRMAKQMGKPSPSTIAEAIAFAKAEIVGFDTREAREAADRARLDAIVGILKGKGE